MLELSHVDDYPEIPVSLRSSRGMLRTGEWRNMRPSAAALGAPCAAACPAGVQVPQYLDLLAAGEVGEALEVFSRFNPFPSITGRVCPHTCESACNRTARGSAVSLRALERHLGDRAAHLLHPKPEDETDRGVAVVGSGPAGLAAAYYLRRAGHRITVIERRGQVGGMLRYGIPNYRLPNHIIDAEIERLQAMGITFRTGASLGGQLSLEEVAADHEAVFVATGAWRPRPLGIDGEELLRSGLAFLGEAAEGSAELPGRSCAILGGGNTAMDLARVIRRLGGEATVLYRRAEADMPAIAEEVRQAKADGTHFRFHLEPRAAGCNEGGQIEVRMERMTPGPPDGSGRPHPTPTGSTEILRFDAVFAATGEQADLGPFPDYMIGSHGRLDVGPDGTTRHEKVFVGGDLAGGPATVVEAIAAGRRAAAAIQARIGDSSALPLWAVTQPVEVIGADRVNPAYLPQRGPVEDPRLPGAGAFEEETATISPAAALAEIERCYSCGHCNACGTCFVFCPDSAIAWDDGPVFDYGVCKGCGICVTECPGQALIFSKEPAA